LFGNGQLAFFFVSRAVEAEEPRSRPLRIELLSGQLSFPEALRQTAESNGDSVGKWDLIRGAASRRWLYS
jgi:hypothetical protein